MAQRFLLITLFALSCAGLVSLGVWQLERAATKRARYEAYIEADAARPLLFDELERGSNTHMWRKTLLRGVYLDQNILLDNRTQGGVVGYEVLTPFVTAGGRTVLVNRGWIALPGARETTPQVSAGDDPAELRGYLGAVPVVGLALSDAAHEAEWMSPQVMRVQRVDIDGLAALLGQELWPDVIYLDAGQPASLSVAWQLPGDGSARHTAYAVQWFLMALVLAVIGLWQLRRRTSRHD